MDTPAGRFDGKRLYVEEPSPLESGKSRRWYVAGIGLIRDDGVRLAKVEEPGK